MVVEVEVEVVVALAAVAMDEDLLRLEMLLPDVEVDSVTARRLVAEAATARVPRTATASTLTIPMMRAIALAKATKNLPFGRIIPTLTSPVPVLPPPPMTIASVVFPPNALPIPFVNPPVNHWLFIPMVLVALKPFATIKIALVTTTVRLIVLRQFSPWIINKPLPNPLRNEVVAILKIAGPIV